MQRFVCNEKFRRLSRFTLPPGHLVGKNSYAPGDPTINVKHTVDEWSRRIKLLLGWHFVQIVDVQGLWVIQVPDQGPVRGFFGAADGPFVVEPPVP
jgi:hypothetical protein